MTKKQWLAFTFLFFLALGLRVYGINWDGGFHLHPDERMLIMVAERIHFFNQLNPQFFNYGSLPIYLLKIVADLTKRANYQEMLIIGRCLSIIFDLFTIFLLYKIAFLLFKNKSIAFFSSFFYGIAFFPIQNSHFFISDVFLTTFTTLFFLIFLKSISNILLTPNFLRGNFLLKISIKTGVIFAAMMATKFTAAIFYPVAIVILFLAWFLFKKHFLNSQIHSRINFLIYIFISHLSSLISYFIFMPYAILDYKNFAKDISLQIQMNNNPYIFPYTLQYVNTLPYLYYLKNIFFWGMGPIISTLSLLGFILFSQQLINLVNKKSPVSLIYILFLFFYCFYFLIIGKSAVKFMRYMLPFYPFIAIMAGYGLYQIQKISLKLKVLKKVTRTLNLNEKFLTFSFAFLSFLWSLMFVNIYSYKHTRIAATEWVLKKIPRGSNLAIEHWDDPIPIFGQEKYNFIELTLYDQPDDEKKWQILDNKLKRADYIIIASNRLYVPLQKLADCQKYKFCYPKTASYYKKLFNEELGFKKIAEFAVYPGIKISSLDVKINDQSADESFTVYDHPKIFIFKKLSN